MRKENLQPKRDFICSCGKNYLSYAALFTHIKQKHDGKAPGPIVRPRSERKRGRPRKIPIDCSLLSSESINNSYLGINQGKNHYPSRNLCEQDQSIIFCKEQKINNKQKNQNTSQKSKKNNPTINTVVGQIQKMFQQKKQYTSPDLQALIESILNKMKSYQLWVEVLELRSPSLFGALQTFFSFVKKKFKFKKILNEIKVLIFLFMEFILTQQKVSEEYFISGEGSAIQFAQQFLEDWLPRHASIWKLEEIDSCRGENPSIIIFSFYNWISYRRFKKSQVWQKNPHQMQCSSSLLESIIG